MPPSTSARASASAAAATPSIEPSQRGQPRPAAPAAHRPPAVAPPHAPPPAALRALAHLAPAERVDDEPLEDRIHGDGTDASSVAWARRDDAEARDERRGPGGAGRRPAGAAPAHAALPLRLRRDRRLEHRRRRAVRERLEDRARSEERRV